MIIVPNEWLVDMLVSSAREQHLVHQFLDRVEAQGHVLALRRRGRLVQKLLSAMGDPQKRAKRLRLILYDPEKVILVEEEQIVALPDHVQRQVPEDDQYLVETAFAKRPSLLVTTDGMLREILLHKQFQVQLLDEFLLR